MKVASWNILAKPLADGEYDAIVLGTGLKECVVSGLLSVKGKNHFNIIDDFLGDGGAFCEKIIAWSQ